MLKPGAAMPKNCGRGIEIVAGDQFGAQDVVDLQEGAQRHHFPPEVPDIEIFNILRLQAVRGVGLDVNLENLVEFVKEIDIGGAQISLQRIEHIAHREFAATGLWSGRSPGRAGGCGR